MAGKITKDDILTPEIKELIELLPEISDVAKRLNELNEKLKKLGIDLTENFKK
jgi:hypothetical protein